jgi:hypothetical protein
VRVAKTFEFAPISCQQLVNDLFTLDAYASQAEAPIAAISRLESLPEA